METVCVSSCCDASAEEGEELHGTAGDLEILCAECVEAERLDDNRGKACKRGVGHLRTHGHDEQQPSLRITSGLPHLVPFEVVVLDSLSVDGDAFDGNGSFALGEESCCGGEIGQPDDGDDSGGYGEGAEDDEDVHPAFEAGCDVADGVAD